MAKKTTTGRRPAPISDPPKPKAEVAQSKSSPPKPTTGKKPAYEGKYAEYWTEEEEPSDAGKPEDPDHKPEAESEVVQPSEQIKAVWSAFLSLHFEDKMTTGAAVAMGLMTFMPWRSTTDTDEMGLFGPGFFVMVFAVVAVLAIWLRKTGRIPKVSRGNFPLLTIGAGAFAALIGVISAFTAFSKGVKGGQTVTTGWPAFGVFCAILCAAGVVVGGLLTLKREKS